MGVSPKVKWLYTDLDNGLILFQLMDFIQPGIVDWKKVMKKFDHIEAKAKVSVKMLLSLKKHGFLT